MTRFVLWCIVVMHSMALLTGCSDKSPARVAWISIEKPPIKVIYIDKQGNLDPVITSKMFHIVKHTPARNMAINNSTSVSVTGNSHQSDTESDSDVTSTTIGRTP